MEEYFTSFNRTVLSDEAVIIQMILSLTQQLLLNNLQSSKVGKEMNMNKQKSKTK